MVHQEIDIKAAQANPRWLNSTSLVSIGGPDGISSVQMNFPHVDIEIGIFSFSFDHTGCTKKDLSALWGVNTSTASLILGYSNSNSFVSIIDWRQDGISSSVASQGGAFSHPQQGRIDINTAHRDGFPDPSL